MCVIDNNIIDCNIIAKNTQPIQQNEKKKNKRQHLITLKCII